MKTHAITPLNFVTLCGLLIRPGERVAKGETKEVQSSHLRPIKVTTNKNEVTCKTCVKAQL